MVGGGFTGLAAAAWLRLLAPEASVAVFEAARTGAGASGRTGGMALAESAAGDLPGLGDVLSGLVTILGRLGVECELAFGGAWEIAHEAASAEPPGARPAFRSPIEWNDAGPLRVVSEVPGGTLDPGMLAGHLARAAQRLGAQIFEQQPVLDISWRGGAELRLRGGRVRAGRVLLANSAWALERARVADVYTFLALAVATTPLTDTQLAAAGLAERKPFYTVDFPYLWGRVLENRALLCGAGILNAPEGGTLADIDVGAEGSARVFAEFRKRLRSLHPAFSALEFTHRWGGPIAFRSGWRPVFSLHPTSPRGILLGAYAGHGVALSVYLGMWAAEALLGRRKLPEWGRIGAPGEFRFEPPAWMTRRASTS